MDNRSRVLAVLNYENYDRLPLVHFGYWQETLIKWGEQGHISIEDAKQWSDGTMVCKRISEKLGFDCNWFSVFGSFNLLDPPFETRVLKENSDGSREFMNSDGVIVVQKDDAGSIPSEIEHTLKDRQSWEEHYKPRLQFREETMQKMMVNTGDEYLAFDSGGLEFLKQSEREDPIGLMAGSLFGRIRDWLGLVGLSYLSIDDEDLLDEIIETVAELCYRRVEYVLKSGARFDFAHYWEDICFKNGPLVSPVLFDAKVGPHYKRINSLINEHGIKIISLDCDGLIDDLLSTWIENGVNTMFPIEVGTWNADISPWRKKYGKELRGVGGMNKTVFAYDYSKIDDEIERLKPLVESGGYIPCPDHRIAPDAKWENIQYYCDKMKETFS